MDTPDGYIEGGKIVGAHGIRGALKFQVYTQTLDYYTPNVQLLLQKPSGAKELVTALAAKPNGRSVLLTLQGVADRNTAEELAGSMVYVPKDVLPKPADGEFYWFQLIGMDVFDETNKKLGRLENIFETGSNDVYVVGKGASEMLLPALDSVVLSIDLNANRITVRIPEGLL